METKTTQCAIIEPPPATTQMSTQTFTARVLNFSTQTEQSYIPAKQPSELAYSGAECMRGRSYDANTKNVAMSVLEYFSRRGVTFPLAETAAACKVSENALRQWHRQLEQLKQQQQQQQNGAPQGAPEHVKPLPRFGFGLTKKELKNLKKRQWSDYTDPFTLQAIRLIIHRCFYAKNITPTLKEILSKLQEDENLDFFS